MKYVLVTGAYGGMGSAACKMLAKNGYGVFALDKKVKEQTDGIFPIEADVTDEESLKRAKTIISQTTKELFAVVHFAGIYRLDSLIEIEKEDIHRIFDINFFGAYLVNKVFVPMIKEKGRILITTSELAPRDPLPFTGIYAVTKGALDKYAYSLKMELQLKDIFVSVLRAGAVDTGMLGVSTSELEKFCQKTKNYACNAERFKKIVDSVEAKAVPPERIAKTALRVLEKKNPKFAYAVNRNPLLILLDLLPKRLRFWAIKMVLEPSKRKK